MNVLSVRGLCKRYGSFALRDVSFDVAPGSITGFIGRNGAGKTTTLKSLLDFVHPDAGEALFFGRPLSADEFGVKQAVGFASGGFGFYPLKRLRTVTDVTRRFYPSWDETAYRRYLALFALDENKRVKELSEGMKVKYALALALSHRARLLVLDEPTSGLDPVSRDELLEIFLQLAQDEGISILFSTHITSDLEKCADHIVYLRRGEVAALIVSEETGHVSIARSGKIYRDVSKERLANILRNFYKNKTEDKTFSLVKDIFNK